MNPIPKISVCMTTRGKNWLLERAVKTWVRQDMDPQDWELVVVDDCSDEPIEPLLEPVRKAGLQLQHYRLEHSDGWRGITVGMLYAFSKARGHYLAETNSHLLLPPSSVRLLYEAHVNHDVQVRYCRVPVAQADFLSSHATWVSLRGFTLNTEATEKMDTVDWLTDVANLWQIPETDCDWTKLWLNLEKFYGSHLCCSIEKPTFYKINPWPEEGFKDYGTDDPAYAGARRRGHIVDLNVWPKETMFGHMAHNDHWQDAMELCPTHLNNHGHTDETARFWDHDDEALRKPTFQDVIDYWSRGERTTDWRVRKAFGYPTPEPEEYVARAKSFIARGKSRLEEM